MQKAENNILSNLPYDLRGGLVVFLVAMPLCLGIALASGAPLFSGVLAGIVGGIVVGALSGSKLSVSGPAAGLTVIVLSAIEKLATYEAFLLAVVLSGIFQVIFGFIKAGVVNNYFPSSVIKGMLAAIGIILILKQIPHALGFDKDAEGEFEFQQADGENTFTEIIKAFSSIHYGAILISLSAIALLVVWDHLAQKKMAFFKMFPSALAIVIIGVLVNGFFAESLPNLALSGNHLVSLPVAQNLQGFLSFFTFPDFSQLTNPQIYVVAITIAIVASLETLLNVEATDKLNPFNRRTPANLELKAQGVGNIVSGLIGGMPLTSVIVRSSVNVYSGSRTKMATILHGILLLVSVVFIPTMINLIPLASLAAILLVTGYKLTKVSIFKQMYELGKDQFVPFIITTLAVLFTDLLMGIGIGLLVGIFSILRANSKHSYSLQKVTEIEKEHFKINLSENVSFLNKGSILRILNRLPDNSTVDLDTTNSVYIDYDVQEVIDSFRIMAKLRNINLNFIDRKTSQEAESTTEPEINKPEVDHIAYNQIFENNRKWVAEKLSLNPTYFKDMARGQSPKFLFIGCSDSRIPANEITGTDPGEMFVHRNIANLVVSTDLNLLSVLQYAVEVLKVEHVIVCGHYGCGGVKAAMTDQNLGLINKWLQNIKDVYRLHRHELNGIAHESDRFKRLVELNVIEQVYNLYKTSIIQKKWQSEATLHVHGWVYDLSEGLIKDLEIDPAKSFEEYGMIYKMDKKTL